MIISRERVSILVSAKLMSKPTLQRRQVAAAVCLFQVIPSSNISDDEIQIKVKVIIWGVVNMARVTMTREQDELLPNSNPEIKEVQ